MVGIGHLLAEGEMQKEALHPKAQAALAVGAAATALGGLAYVAHRQGRAKAEQNYAESLGENKPSILSGGLIGRRAYNRRMAELQAEKQAAAIPRFLKKSITKEDLIHAGVGTLVAGALAGGGYWNFKKPKDEQQQQ